MYDWNQMRTDMIEMWTELAESGDNKKSITAPALRLPNMELYCPCCHYMAQSELSCDMDEDNENFMPCPLMEFWMEASGDDTGCLPCEAYSNSPWLMWLFSDNIEERKVYAQQILAAATRLEGPK